MDSEKILAALPSLPELLKLTASDPVKGSDAPASFSLRRLTLKGQKLWQLESRVGQQVFHENIEDAAMADRLSALLPPYRQLCALCVGQTVTFTQYGKKLKRSIQSNDLVATRSGHDREKSYLLPEGEPVPALVDLGVFTPQYRIIASRSDKYKQINRFIELVDDALRGFRGESIRIMDFGCGKSYLTFILYYYLTEKRKLQAEIIGYDIKADVVRHCNEIAERYGYTGLRFVLGDVSRDTEDCPDVDMLVTLHACDTATDYALDYALRNRIPHILSVPCCQHEVNLSIQKGGELDIFMGHGLLKERMSALLTDAIRTEVLERCGYEVDVIEFVDLSHTPKNLMLRCRLKQPRLPELRQLQALQEQYGFRQTLLKLTAQRLGSKKTMNRPGE